MRTVLDYTRHNAKDEQTLDCTGHAVRQEPSQNKYTPEPAHTVACRRIHDLAGAIMRTAETNGPRDAVRMRAWAQEIVMQCDIIRSEPDGTGTVVTVADGVD